VIFFCYRWWLVLQHKTTSKDVDVSNTSTNVDVSKTSTNVGYIQGYHRPRTKNKDGWGKFDLFPKKQFFCLYNKLQIILPPFCMTHSFYNLFQIVTCVYRTLLSDKQTKQSFSPYNFLWNIVTKRSLRAEANHSTFTKPSSCLLFWHNYLLEADSLHHNKNSKWLKSGYAKACWYCLI